MFKGILTFVVVLSAWILYSILGETSCTRVARAAEPFRTGMSVVHWALKPWANSDQRWWFANVAIKIDLGVQNVIAIQIYGRPLDELCVRKPAAPDPAALPPAPTASAPKK